MYLFLSSLAYPPLPFPPFTSASPTATATATTTAPPPSSTAPPPPSTTTPPSSHTPTPTPRGLHIWYTVNSLLSQALPTQAASVLWLCLLLLSPAAT